MSARNVNLKATEQRRITYYYDHPSSCCRHEKSCLCSTSQICADILHILVIMTWSLVYSLCTWLVHAIYNILHKLIAIKLFVYRPLKSYWISLIWLLFARIGDITWYHLSLLRPLDDDFNYIYIPSSNWRDQWCDETPLLTSPDELEIFAEKYSI